MRVKLERRIERALKLNTIDSKKRDLRKNNLDEKIKALKEQLAVLEGKKTKFDPALFKSNEQMVEDEFNKVYPQIIQREDSYAKYLDIIDQQRELFQLRKEDYTLMNDYEKAHDVTKELLKPRYGEAVAREAKRKEIIGLLTPSVKIPIILACHSYDYSDLYEIYLPMKKEDFGRKLLPSLFSYVAERTLHIFDPQGGNTEGVMEVPKNGSYLRFYVTGTEAMITNYVSSLTASKPALFDEANVDLRFCDARIGKLELQVKVK